MNRHGVVVVNAETLHKLERLYVSEDVVAPGAWASRFGKASGFVVNLAPLRRMSANVKPSTGSKMVLEGLDVVRLGVEVTEDESRPVGVLRFLQENS